MTLDEAIKHCLEVAEEQEKEAEYHRECHKKYYEKDCRECAADHRQLAEWLTELKELRNSIGAVKLKDMKEAVELLQELNAENDQLTSQLLEAKRLLKSAVNDIKDVADNGSCNHCIFNSMYAQGSCCMDGCYKWRYADEVLALIGDE